MSVIDTAEFASASVIVNDGRLTLKIEDPHDLGWVAITHEALQQFVDTINLKNGYSE